MNKWEEKLGKFCFWNSINLISNLCFYKVVNLITWRRIDLHKCIENLRKLFRWKHLLIQKRQNLIFKRSPDFISIWIFKNILKIWINSQIIDKILKLYLIKMRIYIFHCSLIKISTPLFQMIKRAKSLNDIMRVKIIQFCKNHFFQSIKKRIHLNFLINHTLIKIYLSQPI